MTTHKTCKNIYKFKSCKDLLRILANSFHNKQITAMVTVVLI